MAKFTDFMMQLNLPNYQFKLRLSNDKKEIFDEIRKKWLVCTPEEWVRQHFLKWLMNEKRYPASNIAIEAGLKLNALQKRTDILVYKKGQPYLLVECKAPEIKISQKTFDQVFRYNQKINAPIVAVTNGLTHVFAIYQQPDVPPTYMAELPEY